MISVVIPTMFRSHRTATMIDLLSKCDLVSEIIVIANDDDTLPTMPKVITITPSENLFVNPSWNLGFAISSGRYLCIMNDDITFNPDKVFFECLKQVHLTPPCIIGCGGTEMKTTEVLTRPHGWGCFLFMQRYQYAMIPNELKVSFGDDWLFDAADYTYALPMRWFETEMSTTSREPWAIEQAALDAEFWKTLS